MPTDRSVLVRLRANVTDFNRNIGTSSAAVGVLEHRLKGADRDGGAAIDKLSGRLALLAEAAAVLGPALVPLGGVGVAGVAALASQMGFAAVAGGVLIGSMQGLGDALGALHEAHLEPTAENLEKVELAMQRLAPETAEFAREAYALMPVLKSLRDSGAEELFPGLTASLDDLEDLAPKLARIARTVGRATGNMAADSAESLASDRWDEFFDFIATDAPEDIRKLTRTVGDLTHGMASLWMAMDPLNDDAGAWIADAADSFDRWATGLDQTDGFQEFIAYVRENGPLVAEAVGSLANALVQVVQAAAPLGGASLRTIEAVADSVAAIADSDIGTVLLAGAAGMAALSRAGKVWEGVTKTSLGANAVGSIGAMGKALDTTSRNQQRAAMSVTAFAQAERERSAAIRGGIATMGKSAAAVGGLAVATSGAADSIGLTNTAALALMGSMAGLPGIITGGVLGAIMDLASANNDLEDAIRGVDAAIEAQDPEQLTAAQERLNTEMGKQAGFAAGLKATLPGVGQLYSWLGGKTDEATAAKERGAEAQAKLSEYESAAATDRRYLAMLGRQTEALYENIAALKAKQNATLAAFDAETAWRQALKAAREQADKNNAGIRGNTEAALGNREALSGLAAAWNGQSRAVKQNEERYRAARRAFIETAEQMGINKQRARELADEFLNMPKSVATKMILKDEATARLEMIRNALASIKDKTVTVRVTSSGTVTTGETVGGPRAPGVAEGGTIPGQRHPYGDKMLYMLAPGEEVISNRSGQADRHRSLLKRINAGALADGGTTGKDGKKPKKIRREFEAEETTAGMSAAWIRQQMAATEAMHLAAIEQVNSAKAQLYAAEASEDAAQEQLDAAKRSLDAAESLLESTRQQRQAYAQEVRGNFDQNPFGSGFNAAIRSLQKQEAAASGFEGLLNQLAGLGLDGAAYGALAASGDASTARGMLARGAEGVSLFETSYANRETALSSLGNTAADNQFASLLQQQEAAVNAQTAQVTAATAVLDQTSANVAYLSSSVDAFAIQVSALEDRFGELAEAMRNRTDRPITVVEARTPMQTAREIARFERAQGG